MAMCEARLQTRIGKPQREQTREQKRGLDPKPEGWREEADTEILGSQTPSSRLVMSGGQWVSQREGRSFQKPRGFLVAGTGRGSGVWGGVTQFLAPCAAQPIVGVQQAGFWG